MKNQVLTTATPVVIALATALCSLVVVASPADAQERSLRALFIGVEQYEDASIRPLTCSVDDATLLRNTLNDPQYATFTRREFHLLSDDGDAEHKPAKANVWREVRWLSQAAPDDMILLFYSGHGEIDRNTLRRYLLCSDVQRKDLANTAVSWDEVEKLLNDPRQTQAKQAIMILDACHSGLQPGIQPTDFNVSRGDGRFSLRSAKGFSALWREVATTADRAPASLDGRVMMFSCADNQSSYEMPGKPNSVYTHYLVEGLRGAADSNHDGLIGVLELHVYTIEKVDAWARDMARSLNPRVSQIPRMQNNIARDIVLTKSTNSSPKPPDPSAIKVELWLPSPQAAQGNEYVVNCRPGQRVAIQGQAKSSQGVINVSLDGQPLVASSLQRKDLEVDFIADTETNPKREALPPVNVDLQPERPVRFEGELRAGAQPTTARLVVTDAAGQQSETRLTLNPQKEEPPRTIPEPVPIAADEGLPTVAVFGASAPRDLAFYSATRRYQVLLGTRERIIDLIKWRKDLQMVNENASLVNGLADVQSQQPPEYAMVTSKSAAQFMKIQWAFFGTLRGFALPENNDGNCFLDLQINMVDVRTNQLFVGHGVERRPIKGALTQETVFDMAQDALKRAFVDLWDYMNKKGVKPPFGLPDGAAPAGQITFFQAPYSRLAFNAVTR